MENVLTHTTLIKSSSNTKKNVKSNVSSIQTKKNNTSRNNSNTTYTEGFGKYLASFASSALAGYAKVFINSPIISLSEFKKSLSFITNVELNNIFGKNERFSNYTDKPIPSLYMYMKNDVSNLALCIYIKRNKITEFSSKKQLASLLHKDDIFTKDYYDNLMNKYENINVLTNISSNADRIPAKVILDEAEVLLLIAIYEVMAQESYSPSKVTTRLEETRKSKKIKAAQQVHFEKAIELSKKLRDEIDLDLTKLFGNSPVHIANVLDIPIPGMNIQLSNNHLHHMMYIGDNS